MNDYYLLCRGDREECKEWPSFCYKNGGPCKWVSIKEPEYFKLKVHTLCAEVLYPGINKTLYFEMEKNV